MKTISIAPEEMAARLSRFAQLKPLPIQDDPNVPLEANDIVYARKLLSVISLESATDTPINSAAPIVGAGAMTMTMAVCPPGQGPSLHTHHKTFETFTVLKGRFECTWNDDGEHSVILEEFDTLSVPPKVCRAFRNVSDEEAVLQVLITGDVYNMTDIDMAPVVAEMLDAVQPGMAATFAEKTGLTFTAGK